MALAVMTAFFCTLVLAPIGIVAWPFRRDGEVGFKIARIWGRAILNAAGVRVVSEMLAHLPDRPVVFVSNHVSALDIPILFAALPRSFRIVYKSSLLYLPIMGLFLAASRNIPIDRSRAFSAKRSLAQAALRIRNGASVALFPEGTRSGDAPMGSFKRGSFKLAVEAGAPVVPVSLIGLRRVVSPGRITPGVVRMKIHEALEIDQDRDVVERLAAGAEAVIRDEDERQTI